MYIIIHDDDFMIYNREIVSTKEQYSVFNLATGKTNEDKNDF